MDWYKFDLVAWNRHTRDLTPAESGIYHRLLNEYYSTQSPLQNDTRWLSLVARCVTKRDKLALNRVLDRYFPVNGDGLRHNARADTEISDYIARCQTNRSTARQRFGQQVVTESSTNRSLETDRHTKRQGNLCITCGKPAVGNTSGQWHCREHDPYAKLTKD